MEGFLRLDPEPVARRYGRHHSGAAAERTGQLVPGEGANRRPVRSNRHQRLASRLGALARPLLAPAGDDRDRVGRLHRDMPGGGLRVPAQHLLPLAGRADRGASDRSVGHHQEERGLV